MTDTRWVARDTASGDTYPAVAWIQDLYTYGEPGATIIVAGSLQDSRAWARDHNVELRFEEESSDAHS
jgi:hypothetical protein